MEVYLMFGFGISLFGFGIIGMIGCFAVNGHIFNSCWIKGFIATMLGLFLLSLAIQFDFIDWMKEWLPLYIFYGR
jgi:hypothetical protein